MARLRCASPQRGSTCPCRSRIRLNGMRDFSWQYIDSRGPFVCVVTNISLFRPSTAYQVLRLKWRERSPGSPRSILTSRGSISIDSDQAEEDDQLSISIPPSLRPNYKPFLFHFDLANHTFVLEQASGQQSLSVWAVQKFLSESVKDESIISEFGGVSISLIQREDALDTIFGLRDIRWVRILYRLPIQMIIPR